MMSLGQKAIAIGTILLLNLAIFVFAGVLGVIALFASLPLIFVIVKR